jgi:hypothetical protein
MQPAIRAGYRADSDREPNLDPPPPAAHGDVYAAGMGACGKGQPSVHEIAFGALYDVARLSWSSWSSGTAHGRGHYYGFGSYEANVKLYDVKIHHGRRYFSWIKIAEHGHKTRHLKYSGGLWQTR